MSDKKVSVIIPTYKRPVFLSRAIQSVLQNGWENLEIIVVDDNNSGDEYRKETEILMESFMSCHMCIKYIKHEINKNGSAARNTGIKVSTGDYLMFLDDDDEFKLGKIAAQVNFLENHGKEWGACYTQYVDMNKGKIVSYGIESKYGNLLVDELARNLFVHAGSNLMVRREVVYEINGFDESFLRNQDVEFLVRILKKYKLGYVDVLGLIVHVHPRENVVDYIELTNQYVNRFEYEIDSLCDEEKLLVIKMIGLQKFRYYIQKKEIKKAKLVKKENGLNMFNILKYACHLLRRLITHTSYGYPMEKL